MFSCACVCTHACVHARGYQERLKSHVPCGVTEGVHVRVNVQGGTGFLAAPSVSGSTLVKAGPQASEPPPPPVVTSLTLPRHLAASAAWAVSMPSEVTLSLWGLHGQCPALSPFPLSSGHSGRKSPGPEGEA